MKLIVISNGADVENEIAIVEAMIQDGIEAYHLRKPHYTTKDYETYIQRISSKYRSKIVIHSRHNLAGKYGLKGMHISKTHKRTPIRTFFRIFKLRFNNKDLTVSTTFSAIGTLLRDKKKYEYVFLSPIFNSVSKKGKKGRFRLSQISDALVKARKRHKVIYASGGVTIDKIKKVKDLGFDGVCATGNIWLAEDPLAEFRAFKQKCEELSDD